jgi:hypothetical protein
LEPTGNVSEIARRFLPSDETGGGMTLADAAARQAQIWVKVRETQERRSRSVGAPVAAAASPSSLQLSPQVWSI